MPRRSSAERILSRLELFGTKLGLETTRRVLREAGNPHLHFSSVLVAGTNGKGSVAALLSSIGSAAGYRTGLFTSPHLESVTERIKIDGQPIDDERLTELLQEISANAQTATTAEATYFESLFIASCKWFAEQKVDIVIFEVGLGGRLDATNASDPVLSVITEIALEHRDQLGDTIVAIAREKAGIVRFGRPVVVGAREPSGVAQLRRSAARVGAVWRWVPECAEILETSEEADWSRRLRLCSRSGEYELHLLLPGQHQEQNLLTAVIAAETLAESGWHQIDEEAVEAGVARCTWPGRLERVEIPGAQLVVLDSAHNPNAAQALARFLDQHLQSYCLLFGVLEDKDAGEMLPPLLAGASSAVLTRPRSSRGRSARDLMRWVSDSTELTVVDDPDQALSVALAKAEPVVVCGSIYLVGEVRQSLRRRFGTPPPA